MIKISVDQCVPLYEKLFNKILKSGEFPSEWSRAYIVPLHKSGDCYNPDNYRGLAINSCLGKLFTTILNNRLSEYVNVNNLIDKHQIGFRKKSQTSDHMLILKTLTDKCKNTGENLYLGFVDFQKAYDSVWRDGLLFKLARSGVDGNFLKIVRSMYRSSECCVRVGDQITNFFENNVGVKQGEVLSPLLFNLYINDLVNEMQDNDSPKLNGNAIDCLLYADDLVLTSNTEDGLQRKFEKLATFCKSWRLIVNIDKTMVMKVSKSGRLPKSSFTFNNIPLTNTKTYKYLGVVFDSTGTFSSAKANMLDRGLKAMFKVKSVVDREVMSPLVSMDLFDKTVKPVCLYGSEIWGQIPVSDTITPVELIDKLFKKIPIEKINLSYLKWLLGVHKYSSNFAVLGDLGKYPFSVNIIINTIKYWSRLQVKRQYTSLLNDCLVEADTIYNNGGYSWSSWVNILLKLFNKNKINVNLSQVILNVKMTFKTFWGRTVHNECNDAIKAEGKLRTYSKFKQNFGLEDYISELPYKDRCHFARLRISAHTLAIETGRHARPKVPVNQRVCQVCNSGSIEDEMHFVTICDKFRQIRQSTFEKIQNACPNFNMLSTEAKFNYIMSSGGSVLKLCGSLIGQMFCVRSNPRGSLS